MMANQGRSNLAGRPGKCKDAGYVSHDDFVPVHVDIVTAFILAALLKLVGLLVSSLVY